jgi:hypothetical protein
MAWENSWSAPAHPAKPFQFQLASHSGGQDQALRWSITDLIVMYMVSNFWPGATLEQFQAELAELEGKSQPETQLMRSVA